MTTSIIKKFLDTSRLDYQADPAEVYGHDGTIHSVGLVNDSGAETIIHRITMQLLLLLVALHALLAIPYLAAYLELSVLLFYPSGNSKSLDNQNCLLPIPMNCTLCVLNNDESIGGLICVKNHHIDINLKIKPKCTYFF